MTLPFLRARVRSFASDTRGAIAIMAGGFLIGAVALLAIGVDVASLYLDRRRLQGTTDLAAMAAARDIANADRAARATFAANGVASPKELTLTLGHYAADPNVAPANRFRANVAPFNAVRVQTAADAALHFGRALMSADTLTVRGSAVAVNTELAAFSIGSRLASLNGGIANALLSGLLGGSVSLSVMDYNALIAAKVDILPFLSALATRANLTAGSYDQVLAADVRATAALSAMADVAQGTASAVALRRLAASVDASRLVDLNKILSLGPYGKLAVGDPGAGLAVAASALDLVNATAQVANGANQVALDLGVQVPGLLGLTATLNIGERPQNSPWLAIGEETAVVRTAQTRLRLRAQVGGTGSLLGRLITLPIAVDLAAAEARLSNVSCGATPQSDARVDVAVRPSVAELWIGEPKNPAAWANGTAAPQMQDATVLNVLGLVTVKASGHVAATNVADQTLRYSYADIRNATVKTVGTTDALQTTLSSLTRNIRVEAEGPGGFLGLGLGGGVTETLLTSLLMPIGVALDPMVNSLLDLLGLSIGEADVTVRGLRCDGSALVG